MINYSPNSIDLRPATASDEAFLRRLYSSTRREELIPLGWSQEQQDHFLRMQFDAQHRYYHETFSAAAFQIIVKDGEPTGRFYIDRRENEIGIVDVALLPEHRNAGIGTHLLKILIAESESSCKPLTLHVRKQNPAIRFYHRLGFITMFDNDVYLLMERPC